MINSTKPRRRRTTGAALFIVVSLLSSLAVFGNATAADAAPGYDAPIQLDSSIQNPFIHQHNFWPDWPDWERLLNTAPVFSDASCYRGAIWVGFDDHQADGTLDVQLTIVRDGVSSTHTMEQFRDEAYWSRGHGRLDGSVVTSATVVATDKFGASTTVSLDYDGNYWSNCSAI